MIKQFNAEKDCTESFENSLYDFLIKNNVKATSKKQPRIERIFEEQFLKAYQNVNDGSYDPTSEKIINKFERYVLFLVLHKKVIDFIEIEKSLWEKYDSCIKVICKNGVPKIIKKPKRILKLSQNSKETLLANGIYGTYLKLPPAKKQFILKCIKIHEKGNSFSYADSEEQFTNGSHRQEVLKLKNLGIIEKLYKTRYAHYRVIGFELDSFEEKLTNKTLGAKTTTFTELDKLEQTIIDHLSDVDSLAMHNIRVHVKVNEIYNSIKHSNSKFKLIESNKKLMFTFEVVQDIHVTLMVSTKDTVEILFKCTHNPIIIDELELSKWLMHLVKVQRVLEMYSDNVPDIMNWIFQSAEFGLDSKKVMHMPFPERKIIDVHHTMFKIYSKHRLDGNRRLRIEAPVILDTPIQNFMDKIQNIKKFFPST